MGRARDRDAPGRGRPPSSDGSRSGSVSLASSRKRGQEEPIALSSGNDAKRRKGRTAKDPSYEGQFTAEKIHKRERERKANEMEGERLYHRPLHEAPGQEE